MAMVLLVATVLYVRRKGKQRSDGRVPPYDWAEDEKPLVVYVGEETHVAEITGDDEC